MFSPVLLFLVLLWVGNKYDELGINMIDHWQEREVTDRPKWFSLVRAAFQSNKELLISWPQWWLKPKIPAENSKKLSVALNVAFRLLSGIILPGYQKQFICERKNTYGSMFLSCVACHYLQPELLAHLSMGAIILKMYTSWVLNCPAVTFQSHLNSPHLCSYGFWSRIQNKYSSDVQNCACWQYSKESNRCGHI